MAVLSDADRADLWARFMRRHDIALNVTKAQLRTLVDTADSWADTNAAAFNAALLAAVPQATNANVPAAAKALILAYVCLRRAGLEAPDGGG
jgi:hypothetical protein